MSNSPNVEALSLEVLRGDISNLGPVTVVEISIVSISAVRESDKTFICAPRDEKWGNHNGSPFVDLLDFGQIDDAVFDPLNRDNSGRSKGTLTVFKEQTEAMERALGRSILTALRAKRNAAKYAGKVDESGVVSAPKTPQEMEESSNANEADPILIPVTEVKPLNGSHPQELVGAH